MRCVLCGGPFRPPTAADRLTASLTEPSASFRWLCQWQALPALADKRRRGEPPAFFCHKACCALLTDKLRIQPQHSHIWPFVKQQMAVGDSMPDAMTPVSYLGMANVLDAAGWTHTAATMLSPNFTASDRWMLHSPLACTSNASRILKIWQPKLDRRQLSLTQQMSLLLLSPSSAFKVRVLQEGACGQSAQGGQHGRSFHEDHEQRNGLSCPPSLQVASPCTPSTSGGGTAGTEAGAAQPDVLSVLMSHSTFLQDARLVARLQTVSKAMTARLGGKLAGQLQLKFNSSSTEAAVSLCLWLTRHAALVSALDVTLRMCCCNQDDTGADAAFVEALIASAPSAPGLRMLVFNTSCAKTLLLSAKCMALPCVQALRHLTIPDLCTEAQIHCLPTSLCSLDITKSTASVAKLQLISQQCRDLRAVRLGYSLWPSTTKAGPLLLDQALNGWPLLPIVELRFIGCRLPR